MDVLPYRLPLSARPRHYDVELTCRVHEPTFQGRVRIALDVASATDTLELHARDMVVHDAHLERDGRTEAGTASLDAAREKLAIRFPHPLTMGPATLVVTFTGQVSRNMEGLYLSKDGAEECLATQCEETDARGIFPCFDEPAFKASFRWIVTTDKANTVLTNGAPESKVDVGEGMTRWTFASTRPMSSYLVALCVGKLAATPERRVRDVPMRVWALEGKESTGAWSNELAARLLPWFEDYFATPYAFGKYDQVALPSFAAGAMENAGLVTFRQVYLLMDPKTVSFRQKKAIAKVIAHEMAHMWFGDLVTMAWWDDIWLNESFAEWIAHKAVDAMEPDYRIWEDFSQGRAAALAPDALASTHPIYSPVETPAQATELFDLITYQKGSSVMRMLEGFLGEEAFRAGLRTYMQELKFANAQGADLWRHLEDASRQPVSAIMETWILQGGHPLVSVAVEGAKVRLAQERYLAKPGQKTEQSWAIPIVMRYRDDEGIHEARHLLRARHEEVPLRAHGKVRWLCANADALGFYRQAPDDATLRALLAHVDELSAAEQTSLLDDQWGLVRNGMRPLSGYLDALDALAKRATNPTVVDRVVDEAARIEDLLEDAGDPRALESYRRWIGAAFRPRYDALGTVAKPGEPQDAALLRAASLRAMASLSRDAGAIAAALAIAEAEAVSPTSADPNLAGPAVVIAAQNGDADRLARHVRLYDERRARQASPAETQRYLSSFAYFRDPQALRQVLALIDEKRLPLEAVGPLLRLMFTERAAKEPAWSYLKANFASLHERLGDMWTGNLVEASAGIPPRLRDDYVAFYGKALGAVAKQAYARGLESLELRGEFQARTKGDLIAWFQARAPKA